MPMLWSSPRCLGQTTNLVVRGLGRAFLCLSVCLSARLRVLGLLIQVVRFLLLVEARSLSARPTARSLQPRGALVVLHVYPPGNRPSSSAGSERSSGCSVCSCRTRDGHRLDAPPNCCAGGQLMAPRVVPMGESTPRTDDCGVRSRRLGRGYHYRHRWRLVVSPSHQLWASSCNRAAHAFARGWLPQCDHSRPQSIAGPPLPSRLLLPSPFSTTSPCLL